MQTLGFKSYVWKCMLGLEIAYFICLGVGYLPLRSDAARQMHQTLFETMPGFVWGRPLSIVLGAIYMAITAWFVGAYYVWMYNSSLIDAKKNYPRGTSHDAD